jgi:hypothetical protein
MEIRMPVKKISIDLRETIKESLNEMLNTPPDSRGDKVNKIRAAEIADMQLILDNVDFWERSATEPLNVDGFGVDVHDLDLKWAEADARCYFFQNSVYAVRGQYTVDQDKLLVQEAFDSERQKFERLKRKFAGNDSGDAKTLRQQIPEDVRIAVWRRDGGACVRCSSRDRLEYHHIVPVSRGGSNTVRNIELLCEVCNRSKSNHIR